jgi:hypothetical protein
MAGVVSRRRCVVGKDIRVLAVRGGEVDIEGALRLRPGSVIDIHDGGMRSATVLTWAVTRLGSEGTVYGGRCRWIDPSG